MNPAQNLEEGQPPAAESAPRPTPVRPPAPRVKGRRRAFVIFFLVLFVLAIGAGIYWYLNRGYESTDDAQVEMHLNPITPRVDGTIVKV